MLPTHFSFVDLETSGARSRFDRVIEIGIVRVENDKIVESFSSLINPEVHIPEDITRLTGIRESDLVHSPSFFEIADKVQELLKDTVFVAHNVRFDYGFLKMEFKRLNKSFTQKHFCTVRLSRALYPQYPRHNLDSLIERMNYTIEKRHRALDDAQVLFHFYKKAKKEFPQEIFESALKKVLQKPYLPIKLSEKTLDDLPESPGVYIFYGSLDNTPSLPSENLPLYIGKSINLKERVLSHFSGDIHSPLEMKIAQQIESIETIQTSGELGALFLESQLIKKRLPLLNRQLRLKQELVGLKKTTTPDGYLSIEINTFSSPPVEDLDSFMGFFRSRKQAKDFLADIAKENTLCEKILGLEKSTSSCFGYRLERCKGACQGKESPLSYNMRYIKAFSQTKIKQWPFDGPVVISEINELQETTEHFLVDKWCLLSAISTDSYGTMKETDWKYEFDLDTYKILSRFLKDPRNLNKIRKLNNDEMKEFILTSSSL